ncbi:MAG: SAM-dependent methyltransferase [Oscillospiraceae bacterium]|nr:SAM-dependent methyltransferase [Oscillospiraceae bacterium]
MANSEYNWDKLLRIATCGRDETNADAYHHPYEPTPYSVLERMADSGFFGREDVVLDYGCGKGRVGFFLSHRTQARTIGIEYDEHIFEGALENRRSGISQNKPDFVLTHAEEYAVPAQVNRCYFFNPFSVEILRAVCARIIASWYEDPREILLFFYYPADEYISCLMTLDELEFFDEISCDDLFPGKDPRERILIFQLPDYEMET